MDTTLAHHTKGKAKNSGNKRRRNSSLVKVVYISTPMKVKTSASRFRSLVQELTGRDSDISRFTDIGSDYNDITPAATTTYSEIPRMASYSNEFVQRDSPTTTYSEVPRMASYSNELVERDSPMSSDSLIDDMFNSDMVEKLEGMFPSSMFFSSDQLIDVPAIY